MATILNQGVLGTFENAVRNVTQTVHVPTTIAFWKPES